MSDEPKMRKVDRLAVAAAVAPTIRGQSERTKNRRVAVVDKDGNVMRYTTLGEVQKAALETARIELAVQDGVRPRSRPCVRCGALVTVAKRGSIKKICDGCLYQACIACGRKLSRRARKCRHCAGTAKKPVARCALCGVHVGRATVWSAKKRGVPTRCRACGLAARVLPPRQKLPPRHTLCVDCGVEVPLRSRNRHVPPRCMACGHRKSWETRRARVRAAERGES